MAKKSYIDENGEAIELDKDWFSKAKKGFPQKSKILDEDEIEEFIKKQEQDDW